MFETTRLFLKYFALGTMYLSGILLFLVGLILLGARIVSKSDRLPYGDAVYFAFITALTIGYGDFTPKSRAARITCILLGICGMVFIGIIVACAVAAAELALTDSEIWRRSD